MTLPLLASIAPLDQAAVAAVEAEAAESAEVGKVDALEVWEYASDRKFVGTVRKAVVVGEADK